MALKKELKLSEARILILLSNVNNLQKYARVILSKLDMDYSYGLDILSRMIDKGWLKKISGTRFNIYELTSKGQILCKEKAIKVIHDGG